MKKLFIGSIIVVLSGSIGYYIGAIRGFCYGYYSALELESVSVKVFGEHMNDTEFKSRFYGNIDRKLKLYSDYKDKNKTIFKTGRDAVLGDFINDYPDTEEINDVNSRPENKSVSSSEIH